MLIGVRTVLVILVPFTFALTSGVVDAWWWRTAQSNSRMLAGTLDRQIIGEVKRELDSLIDGAVAAQDAIRTVLVRNVIDVREADKREFVFLAQLQAQPALSWIAFGWPDGGFFAAHKLKHDKLEVSDIPMGPEPRTKRVDSYRILDSGVTVQNRDVGPTTYDVAAQPWYRGAFSAPTPLWFMVTRHPGDDRPSIAYAGGIEVDGVRQGVLAVMIDLDRLSRFLASLTVGRTGAAFVLGSDGSVIAAPSLDVGDPPDRKPPDPALLGVARLTHDRMLAKADPLRMQIAGARVVSDDVPYAVNVTPLGFMGWEVTTVIPEADFLGEIDSTNRSVTFGLVLLVLVAAGTSTVLARHLLVGPLTRIVEELGRIQRFELDRIDRRHSWLRELDVLSQVISNMAAGLAAFRKYLPTDLVNALIAEGIEAHPGVTIRPMTVLFADIAGFTGLSERMGEAVVPLLTRYIDVVSTEVAAHGGTIDKFMGDGVMAFWGAPEPNPTQEADACRAALACFEALGRADIRDDRGRGLAVRIGINSGDVLVGNIGTESRLNYTVIGDAVNVASRLEAANKAYGTSIVIGAATRRQIGHAFLVRRLDSVAVPGRVEALDIYELVGLADPGHRPAAWVSTYEEGLSLLSACRFSEAMARFGEVMAMRGRDEASVFMMERCRSASEHVPSLANR